MFREMNIYHLSQDELVHELTIRGTENKGTVDEMRKLLSNAKRMERAGSTGARN